MSVTDLLRAAHAALSPAMTPTTAPGRDDGIDARAEVVRTALAEVLEGEATASEAARALRERYGS
jgi:hypothetical protein